MSTPPRKDVAIMKTTVATELAMHAKYHEFTPTMRLALLDSVIAAFDKPDDWWLLHDSRHISIDAWVRMLLTPTMKTPPRV